MLLCVRTTVGIKRVDVATFAQASKEVRKVIEENDLGSRSFHIATVCDKKGKLVVPLATVTYNGRVWSCKDGSEIVAG